MREEVGLWIDHKKTVIIDGDGSEKVTLKSNLEKHVRFTGDRAAKSPMARLISRPKTTKTGTLPNNSINIMRM